jgi:hypothetical protein
MNDDWTDVANSCNQDPDRPGKKKQTRTIKTERQNNGAVCPTDTQYQNCDVDCEMNNWTDAPIVIRTGSNTTYFANSCNKFPNRPGKKKQTRTVKTEHQNNGTVCPTDTTRYSNCDVDCVVSNFGAWSACEYDDETGNTYKYSTRTVTTPAQNDGLACPSWMRMKMECSEWDKMEFN